MAARSGWTPAGPGAHHRDVGSAGPASAGLRDAARARTQPVRRSRSELGAPPAAALPAAHAPGQAHRTRSETQSAFHMLVKRHTTGLHRWSLNRCYSRKFRQVALFLPGWQCVSHFTAVPGCLKGNISLENRKLSLHRHFALPSHSEADHFISSPRDFPFCNKHVCLL
ncbi:similar to 2310002F18Rik protein, isoform CRA_b, partial [Rattus norvegicus]